MGQGLFDHADVLDQAALTRPPLVELSHRLGLPHMLTIDEWVDCVSDRSHPAHSQP